ncbi:hypothetical protein AAW14_06565 [Streptomyces hygroscopicus]|uniref:hypothetical protein n=1 Tax=Streptomyces hygroscopicus TaxID=1912 RepID=UPI002240191A|nr:hypothetical protein [Streptomyces hygroscopicus]MCW7941698.1 hypothetical protein [Streptomyces hygroscopicus]
MAIPGNFLSATTEQVDPDTSGWTTVQNCTKSLGSGGRNGDGCLMLTSTAAAEMQARTASTYTVTPWTEYYTFADASSSTQPERIGIQWLDDSLTQISITWGLTTDTASSSWHRISVAGVAPSNAAYARVMLSATATASGKTSFFENVYLGPPIRTSGNLFTFDTESGGELDASGWVAENNSTVTRDAPAVAWPVNSYNAGGHVIKMTVSANGSASMRSSDRPDAEPGREYLAYCYLNPPTTSAYCWMELRWYDAVGNQIGAQQSVLNQPGTGWYQQYASGVAPAGTASCSIGMGISGGTAGQVLRAEGVVVMLMPDLYPGTVMPYADAGFEQGIGSWTVASGVATIAQSAPWGANAYSGEYALTVTSSTATKSVLTSAHYPVTAGVGWRAETAVKVTAGAAWTLAVDLAWYDSLGTLISTTATPSGSIPFDGNWWLAWSDVTAPSNAATAQIRISLTATAATSTIQVDNIGLFESLPAFEVDPDNTLARMVLILRELDTTQYLTLYRIVAGRQTIVRGSTGYLDSTALTSTQLTVEDYEAPLGQDVSYRAELYTSTGTLGSRREDGPVQLTVDDPSLVWIKDPVQPERNVQLRASEPPDWARPIEQSVLRVRGRRNPVVLSDVRGGLTGTLKIWTLTDAEREAMHFALDTGDTLLLQFAAGYGLDDTYVAVGEATESRVSWGGEPRRLWQLPLTQVDAPTGGTSGTAGWTVQDLAATWATVLDVVHTYATVLDLTLDQRET